MADEVSRGTKCFSCSSGKDYNGVFPRGFIDWVKQMGWWREERCYLCSGTIQDGFTVDIRPDRNPTLVADATNTGLEPATFSWVMIDPPYSAELAERLYGTGKYYYSINTFVKEAERLTKNGGLILTLSYEIPKIPKGTKLLAVWGIYTVPICSYMRCFTVFKKGDSDG